MVFIPPHTNYFEGILQLRGTPKSVLAKIRHKTKKDKRSMIVKVKHFKFGSDVYFSDKRYMATLGRWLANHYDGVLKKSATLHTHKKGEALYRLTIAFRYFPYYKGQGLELNGQRYTIVRIDKEVTLQERGGKKIKVAMEKLCA